jgi:uncharacterized protein YdeI (YjbR/CyaY-like superfamily)
MHPTVSQRASRNLSRPHGRRRCKSRLPDSWSKGIGRALKGFVKRHLSAHRGSLQAVSESRQGRPILAFTSRTDFATWLDERHESSGGIWLRIARKGSGINSVSYHEALDVALRYGWIDGQKASYDDDYWLQRFGPRTARSKWSKVNRGMAQDLIDRGEMQPAGLREVERAQADGRWAAAYDAQSTATVPEDLRRALDADPVADAFFSTLDSRNRYAILYRLADAKRPETRVRRLRTFVAMLHNQEKLHP